ncbi:MAG: sugar ABC transporter permease [Chloroflexi bacterium]|nr:sugar ABC transporter permease [Chloroflexota bacterium]
MAEAQRHEALPLAPTPLARPRRSLARREALYGYAFISPWIVGLLAFTAGPLLAAFYFSFTEYPILSAPTWVGLRNYERIFTEDRSFLTSLANTAIYVIVRVPLHLTIAFVLALALSRSIRGIGVFRTAIYLPSMIPIVALSVIWRILLDPRIGYVNYFASYLGLPEVNWLTSEVWIKPVIIMISLWQVGVPMIIFLAGLGGIPDQLYEAAQLDGAGPWQRLRNVTLPMMTPSILYNVIIDIINSFQVFAFAFILTKGGPNDASLFYVLYIYRQAFQFFQMGYASALSAILFFVVLALTILLLRSSRYWVSYERI